MLASTQGLDDVARAFAAKIQELQELTLLRVDNGSKDISSRELAALDTSVQAIEQKLRDIQHFIGQEKQAITKARALTKACALQQDQLEYIGTHLPARLPEANSVSINAQPQPVAGTSTSSKELPTEELETDENADTANVEAQPAAAKQTAGDKKKRAKAPRRYISQAELASVSGYMRGRLTIETVNSAIDDAASHSEANAKLMAATKSNSVKPADRKRATTLLHCVTGKEGIRGRYWFLESDLKGGTTLKMDKTGKAILTVLRHLGRLTEVRVSLDGTPQVAHVLQPE
ncbi:TPA: hypothetical protein ACH3X2_005721 [Trebouxia sp. C0005]|nr:MAG: spindle and kinetochore-associated 1 protein [Trebouxia sp. A1-2]